MCMDNKQIIKNKREKAILYALEIGTPTERVASDFNLPIETVTALKSECIHFNYKRR